MGCDIHMHTEVKIGGVWHHYSAPKVPRNYRFFCHLVGVRGPIEGVTPMSEPRGLPEDLSALTKIDADRDGDDGHSHSWLSSAELAAALKWYDEQQCEFLKRRGEEHSWFSCEHTFFGYLFGNGWELRPEDRGDAYPAEIEDVRAVFWFDN